MFKRIKLLYLVLFFNILLLSGAITTMNNSSLAMNDLRRNARNLQDNPLSEKINQKNNRMLASESTFEDFTSHWFSLCENMVTDLVSDLLKTTDEETVIATPDAKPTIIERNLLGTISDELPKTPKFKIFEISVSYIKSENTDLAGRYILSLTYCKAGDFPSNKCTEFGFKAIALGILKKPLTVDFSEYCQKKYIDSPIVISEASVKLPKAITWTVAPSVKSITLQIIQKRNKKSSHRV